MDEGYEKKNQKEAEAENILNSIDAFILGELGIKLSAVSDKICYKVDADQTRSNRLDCYYYQPKFIKIEDHLEKSKYPIYPLGDAIIDLTGGATPKVEGDFYTKENGIPFLRVQNISKQGVSLEDVKYIKREVHEGALKRSQLKKDDLVYTITGRIGSVAVIPDNFEGNINQHSGRFHLKNKIKDIDINPHYVAIFLNTSLSRLLAVRKATGGTRPALDYKALKSLIVIFPPLEIQNRISDEVKSKFKQIKHLKKEAIEVLDKAKNQVEKMILGL